jgi:hypothetical protein
MDTENTRARMMARLLMQPDMRVPKVPLQKPLELTPPPSEQPSWAAPATPPPAADDASSPWHGGLPKPQDQAQPFAARDQPTEVTSSQAIRDPRRLAVRAGDAAWTHLVQPNLSGGHGHGIAPQVSLEYNPFQDPKQVGVNARWRYEF